MFGIGTPELIVILVVALIVFGPEKLPQIAAQAGKAIRDFRQMSADLTGEFNRTLAFEEAPPAAALDPSPALSQETITAQAWPESDGAADGASGAPSGQNGHDAITTPLAVQTIAGDVAASAATETIWQEPVPANGHSDESLLATKADPLAAVSLLEEPVRMLPVVPDAAPAEPAPGALAEAAPAVAAVETVAEPAPVALAETVAAPEPAAAPAVAAIPADEPAPAPAVAASEPAAPDPAPVPAATPELDAPAAAMNGAEAFANWDAGATRVRVDPGAEMTIREKIEAQIAAEAFRERRRRARYSRYGRVR